MANNPFKENHIAPVLYDDIGHITAEAPFTSKLDAKRYVCAVPPGKVIPVIFVPGIMGSNLMLKKPIDYASLKKYGDVAWRPDSKKYMLKKFGFLNAAERRRVLDPNNTDVAHISDLDDCGKLPFESVSKEVTENWKREFKRRGWCSVMLSSYGPMLCVLEYQLNRMYYHGELSKYWKSAILEPSAAARSPVWGKIKGNPHLTEAHLKKGANYWYPVHAVGYNWLQSNAKGGTYLANKIQDIINHYNYELNYDCAKVILVTHSMGGLVARAACHPDIGKKADAVLGIVHGEMPANGAAAAYSRCHAGFEANGGPEAIGGAFALGWNGPEVAGVFSNSPGALQLLPNKQYGPDWLQVTDWDKRTLFTLPKSDPYKEIYRQKDKWWRLMTPEWIDPVPKTTPSKIEIDRLWEQYLKNLDEAENFHDTLGTYYHPNTYAHYGADPKFSTWGTLSWRQTSIANVASTAEVKEAALRNEDGQGIVVLQKATDVGSKGWIPWWNHGIDNGCDLGDGTVPARSGSAAQVNAKLAAAMTGFDHQGSYKNEHVQEFTLCCIAHIAQEAP